jgi:hypothetical protein
MDDLLARKFAAYGGLALVRYQGAEVTLTGLKLPRVFGPKNPGSLDSRTLDLGHSGT